MNVAAFQAACESAVDFTPRRLFLSRVSLRSFRLRDVNGCCALPVLVVTVLLCAGHTGSVPLRLADDATDGGQVREQLRLTIPPDVCDAVEAGISAGFGAELHMRSR